jgi:hypothetical protein
LLVAAVAGVTKLVAEQQISGSHGQRGGAGTVWRSRPEAKGCF